MRNNTRMLRIAAIETFYGGSHQAFLDGLKQHAAAEISLFTLPDKQWKWRMKTGIVEIVQRHHALQTYDLLLVGSLCNVAELKALLGDACPPVVLYMHENQLDYPKSVHQKSDFHIEWIDCMNTIVADYVIFNSRIHRTRFLTAFERFLSAIPRSTLDADRWGDEVRCKAGVIYPGTDIPGGEVPPAKTDVDFGRPTIVWNHRWEHDKQPELFVRTMVQCAQAGMAFDLILLGDDRNTRSGKLDGPLEKLASRTIHRGFAVDRNRYFELLSMGDIVVSTAIQENFGLSVVEAVQCGCFPVLPDRLSYPELIPVAYHDRCLYSSDNCLSATLMAVVDERRYGDLQLARAFECHLWKHRIAEYDSLFCRLARAGEVTHHKRWPV